MITIKHLQINQISGVSKSLTVGMPLTKNQNKIKTKTGQFV